MVDLPLQPPPKKRRKAAGMKSAVNFPRKEVLAFNFYREGNCSMSDVLNHKLRAGLWKQKSSFKHQHDKWAECFPPAQPKVPKMSWGDNLAKASAVVVAETQFQSRGKKRSTQAIINEAPEYPMEASTANKHIKKQRAGQLPREHKKPCHLTREDELRTLTMIGKATDEHEPFSCAEV
jgi:hypothetical protein